MALISMYPEAAVNDDGRALQEDSRMVWCDVMCKKSTVPTTKLPEAELQEGRNISVSFF